MKMISDGRRRQYLTRIMILLTTAALVVCMTGCFTPFRTYYRLTISSTPGGYVSDPGEGAFTYWEGTVVNLVAEPDAGCRFANWTGNVSTIANVEAATNTITMNDNYAITAKFEAQFMISAGNDYTVGLRHDGTVIAAGENCCGQCDVADWTDIVQVAAGCYHTVGLKPDGTVVAVGLNSYGQRNVGDWTGITQVCAEGHHTVGLKTDGRVVAVGDNSFGQCNVSEWTNIAQVATGYLHSVGLRSDGTVVAVGNNEHGQCNVGGWAGIVQVAAGHDHTVGLKKNGTVVAVGGNSLGSAMSVTGQTLCRYLAADIIRWGLNLMVPWLPWGTTSPDSAMSMVG